MTNWRRLTLKQGNRARNGFTLIEVLIVVAIVGILAAIAYPQYGDYVKKSRRADGHLAMLDAVQQMERCKSTNYSYTGCTLASTKSPEEHYTIALSDLTATTFTITATGTGPQASDTDCVTMTVNQLGIQTPDKTKRCWPS